MCPVDLQPLVFAGKIDWECEFRIDSFNYSTAAFRRHMVQWPGGFRLGIEPME